MRNRKHKVLSGLLKPVLVLLILIAFFMVYNAYLVDASLETLKLSLEQTATAQTPVTVEGVGVLLNHALLTEITKPDTNLKAFNTLDFASSMANEARSHHQLKGTQFVIKEAYRQKQEERFFLLRWFDVLNREVQKFIRYVKRIFNEFVDGEKLQTKPLVRYDLVKQAKALEKKGDLKGAEENYRQFIKLNETAKGVGLIEIRYAFVMMKLGEYEKAKEVASKVARRASDPTEERVSKNLIDRVNKLEKISVERDSLLKRIRRMTRIKDLQEAYLQLGLLDTQLFDIKDAQKAFKKVIDLDPKSEIAQSARFNLGFAYKLVNNIKESERIFLDLSETATTSEMQIASALQLASVKRMAGRFKEAAEILEDTAGKATDVMTAAMAQFGAGYVYLFNLNDTRKAQEAFEKIQELKAEYPGAEIIEIEYFSNVPLREYAFYLFELGRFDEAKSAFETVLETDENDAWSYSGLGGIYELEGDRKKGYEYIQKGYELQPDYFTTAAMGYIEGQMGEPELAINLYKQSIKYNPDYLYPYYNLGYIYILQGKYAEAVEILKKGRDLAVKLDKSFPLLQNNLGYSYFYLDQYNEALKMFNEAIQLDAELVDAWYNRALVYEALQDWSQYERDIQKAFSLNPDYKDLKERIGRLKAA